MTRGISKTPEETRLKQSNALKGRVSPNKGNIYSPEMREKARQARLGKKHTPETIQKLRNARLVYMQNPENRKKIGVANTGDRNGQWKGSDVKYQALHMWVRRKLGNAKKCAKDPSHKSKKFVWANKTGKYLRELSDWHELCNSCNILDGVKMHERFNTA